MTGLPGQADACGFFSLLNITGGCLAQNRRLRVLAALEEKTSDWPGSMLQLPFETNSLYGRPSHMAQQAVTGQKLLHLRTVRRSAWAIL